MGRLTYSEDNCWFSLKLALILEKHFKFSLSFKNYLKIFSFRRWQQNVRQLQNLRQNSNFNNDLCAKPILSALKYITINIFLPPLSFNLIMSSKKTI
jgi:hypothetical protein